MYAFSDDFLNHRGFVGNAGALDNLVGIQYLFFRVMAFFPFYLVVIQQFFVTIFDCSHIGNEYVKAFLLGKDGSPCTTFCGS